MGVRIPTFIAVLAQTSEIDEKTRAGWISLHLYEQTNAIKKMFQRAHVPRSHGGLLSL